MNGIALGATVLPIRVAGGNAKRAGAGRSSDGPINSSLGSSVRSTRTPTAWRSTRRGWRSWAWRNRSRPSTTVPRPAQSPAHCGWTRSSSHQRGTTVAPARVRQHLRAGRLARGAHGGRGQLRESSVSVHVVIRAGLGVFFDRRVPLVSAIAPSGRLFLRLGAPRLTRSAAEEGILQARRLLRRTRLQPRRRAAALVPASADPAYAASQAVKAGARLVVVYGDALPGGGIGLDEGVTVPVVTVPGWAGRAVLDAFRLGSATARVDRNAQRRGEQSRGAGGAVLFAGPGLRRLRQARPRRGRRQPAHRRPRQGGGRHRALFEPERLGGGGRGRGGGGAAGPVAPRARRLRPERAARRIGEAASARVGRCAGDGPARPRRGAGRGGSRSADDDELRPCDRGGVARDQGSSSCAISRRGG